jgi:hypothetical protein
VPNPTNPDDLFVRLNKAGPTIDPVFSYPDLGVFLLIPADNIDLGILECFRPIHGDVQKMSPLDFQALIVQYRGKGHYLLKDGICQLKKQVAIGKNRLLAVEEGYEDVVERIRSRPRSLHIVVKALQGKSLMEDPGYPETIICRMLGINIGKLKEYLLLTTSKEDQGMLLLHPSSIIKQHFLKPLVAERKRLLRQLYDL